MKLKKVLWMAAMALPLLLTSCHTHKKVVAPPMPPISDNQKTLMERVDDNASSAQFVTSKLKFTVEVGEQNISLTGNLKMKRDDVIRLQLMAFGFVEAARLEFTQEYVLILDRINKQFLKVPYFYVDFLRNSGINFFTLQSLFWNELFQPGKPVVDVESWARYTTMPVDDEDLVVSLDDEKMHYNWLVTENTGRIKMANIMYQDPRNGNTQLSWEYKDFKNLLSKFFPSDMNITLTTPEKEVKLGLKLNYLGTESDWDTRTIISNKYHEVTIDEILARFMAL